MKWPVRKEYIKSCQLIHFLFPFFLTGLYNLRGSDVPYNPVFFAYAIITKDDARFKITSFTLFNGMHIFVLYIHSQALH